MNILGSGRISAGEHNEKISVSGSGKIDGNIRCIALSCSGSVKGEGSIVCNENISVSGSCHFTKSMSSKNVTVSGSVKVDEDITATNTVKISGSVRCGGTIKCAALKCSGSADIGKEIAADEVYISGRINCAGLVNAEKIEISLDNGLCRIGAIGGSEIKVHNDYQIKNNTRMPLLFKLVGNGNGRLNVDELIEGDIVAIEYVKAPCVVGRVVAIGTGCEIDLVRYSEEIEIHPDAKVGRSEKI